MCWSNVYNVLHTRVDRPRLMETAPAENERPCFNGIHTAIKCKIRKTSLCFCKAKVSGFVDLDLHTTILSNISEPSSLPLSFLLVCCSRSEQAHLAQLVGADEAEHNVVDAHAFLEGLCGECLEEHESTKSVTLEDIAHTEEEALNLVSEPHARERTT